MHVKMNAIMASYDESVDQVLFDHLINVNLEISRLVYEMTCMSKELWNLSCENYKLKKEISYVQRSDTDSLRQMPSTPNGAKSEPQNADMKQYSLINDVLRPRRRQEDFEECKPELDDNKTARCDPNLMNSSIQRRVSLKQNRCKPSSVRYPKQKELRFLDFTSDSYNSNRTVLPIQNVSIAARRKHRKLKKYYYDESDDNYKDSYSPSGSAGSQDGRLL